MSDELPTAYPLQWPTGRSRTTDRQVARFATNTRGGYFGRRSHSVSECIDAIVHELDLMGADETQLVVSTNLRLGARGWPLSNQSAPRDPGAAIYFYFNRKPVCLACDQWAKVEDNLWAVALTLEAMRGIDRWGAAQLEATFTGYAALPAPEAWWQVLGVPQNADADTIQTAYRQLAKEHHPDKGGSDAAMARINAAYDAARKVTA